ncbi:methyltransferase domain-containing protein [Dongia deserti]|uniref:methyltransferase domain-containing protein n=1 Tax=Dongia deserti TaxID=2268030 RepID=UPI000E65793A|nr:methyltransferase domain-containing protein [Dongia deserti]
MVQSTVPEQARIFDRRLLRERRGRAARDLHAHDFLLKEIGERLCDRLSDIARSFPLTLDLGARDGLLARTLNGRGGIETLIQSDASLINARGLQKAGPSLVADEELLPFKAECFDAILSNLALHWVNDLPGALVQIRSSLKPDGLFLASLFGSGTLTELRSCLMEAELAELGGASPRISPFADLRDAAGLLQRAGFALPVADVDTITVTYGDVFALLRDLRGMGETNVLLERLKHPTRRTIFARTAALYQDRFADREGRLCATFQVLFLTGWAPHESQQQPARRGSGKTSLKDVFRSS